MVNAELQHNPYLLETEVKFNGQEPKINSQIEKYENKLLADWVRDVPKMFYDEMNGYDFDLFFSGTEYDFQKLQQTFISLGVTSDQVRLIMRNELEDAEIKSNEIRNLIDWLKENRNRQFDFDNFYDANRGLLEETFSCIVIRGKDEVPEDLTFTLENVKSVDEIAGTNLTYVPVVFVIEAETIQLFRNDLLALFGRKEVEQNQLFFCISPAMDKEYVVRFISDLGIEEPQLISRIDDGNVATYIKNYPMVAYVGEVIRVFENEVNTLDDRLKAKNEQSAIENAEVYEQISALQKLERTILNRLNEAGIDYRRNGSDIHLSGNMSLSFKGFEGEMLLHRLDLKGICVSTGSACDSKNTQVSHVLKAMAIDSEYAIGTIRVSLSKANTLDEALKIADSIISIVQ